jgi:hypothetical protein
VGISGSHHAVKNYREFRKDNRPAVASAELARHVTEPFVTYVHLLVLSWQDDEQLLDSIYSLTLMMVELTKHLNHFKFAKCFF